MLAFHPPVRAQELGVNEQATEYGIRGQAIGWGVASRMDRWRGQAGIRYIPELSYLAPVKDKYTFEAEFSLNAYGSGLYWSKDSTVWDGKIKPYRAWLKFSGDQFEVRAGLQKINFGSASMLRPLMWFDQIDPRDPLQLTDGVYALLGRIYFLNNANIWIWGLLGNDRQKGWEFIPSVKNVPEFGGRVQIPVERGELGTTYHYRVANAGKVYTLNHGEKTEIREKRLALDGKFDLGVGLWFEAVMVHQEIHLPELRYRRMLNLGMDYTFGLGNGLNMMTEVVTFGTSEKALTGGEDVVFSALSLNYPLSIINNLSGIVFYDWENNNIYNFINWSWQFDKWSFYIMGFWNPETFDIYQNIEGTNLYAGKGLQFMAVFNH
jgi:hypothetical protein